MTEELKKQSTGRAVETRKVQIKERALGMMDPAEKLVPIGLGRRVKQ